MNNYENYLKVLDDLETLLKCLTEDQIVYKPAEDKWNVNEIAAHLADAEAQAYIRLRSALADKVPFLVFNDQDNWSKELKHSSIPVNESLSFLKTIRLNNYILICSLSEDQLNRQGLHSTRGRVTVRELIDSYINHINVHIAQIKRNVADYEKVYHLPN